MPSNRGKTSLKTRRRRQSPMREFDRLPAELRAWVAGAMLPWRPRTVQAAFDKAMARTGDPKLALSELNRIQRALVAKDAGQVWGKDHPQAG